MRDKRQRDNFWLGAGLNNQGVRADSHTEEESREREERELGLFVLLW